MTAAIRGIAAYKIRLPLKRPYHLSLLTLEAFDSVIVRVVTQDGEGYGETTDVPGYFTQNLDDAWALACRHGVGLPGLTPAEALEAIVKAEKHLAFAATPLVTALESLCDTGEETTTPLRVPLLGVVQGESLDEIADDAAKLMDAGYGTLKFKVGFSVTHDLERVRHLQRQLRPGVTIRIDANQGYTYEQSVQFLKGIDPKGIELLEQPMGMHAWDEMILLQKISPVPLMLDEAITGEEELDRTIETGCAGVVKFKLMKCGSFRHLEGLIKKSLEAGLKVILGNGVATDIGCLHEAKVAHRTGLTLHAGEMNGFLKAVDRFLDPGMEMDRDDIVLPAGRPAVRWDILSRYVVEEMHWGEVER